MRDGTASGECAPKKLQTRMPAVLPWPARWSALSSRSARRNLRDLYIECGLWLKLNDMVFVVDAHGAKLIQDVLSEQTVKRNAKAFRQLFEVHHRHRLRKHDLVGEFQVHSQAQGVTDDSRSALHGPGSAPFGVAERARVRS